MAENIIVLPKPLSENEVYTIDNVKYAWPYFRLKRTPYAFWFDRDEYGAILLKCMVEVYSEKENVYPFQINNPALSIVFGKTGLESPGIELTFGSIDFQNAPTSAYTRDILAQLSVRSDLVDELIEALTSDDYEVTLDVSAELLWQEKTASSSRLLMANKFLANTTLATVQKPAMVVSKTSTASTALSRLRTTNLIAGKFAVTPASAAVSQAAPAPAPAPAPATTPPAQAASAPAPVETQQLLLKESLKLDTYERNNSIVFGAIQEKRSYWNSACIDAKNEITIHYQKSEIPDAYNLLPQEFRIKVNDATNLPKITFNMIPGENRELIELYKIQVEIDVGHYYHPKSKIDLYTTLKKMDGNFKYCTRNFGGFKEANFKWENSFLSLLKQHNGYVLEENGQNISSPADGFTINVVCPLDYFTLFTRNMIGSSTPVGRVDFEVEGKDAKIEKISIPLKLNIRKLTQMEIPIEREYDKDRYYSFPIAAILSNRFDHVLDIEGCLMTFLSKERDNVIDAQLKDVKGPFMLNSEETVKASLGFESMNELNSQGRNWTDFECEPYGVSISEDTACSIMEQVIDSASNSIQEWTLEVSCSLLENWDYLDETVKEPFKLVDKVFVEVRTATGMVKGVNLKIKTPPQQIKMSSSLSSIFKTQQINTRNYQYRQKTVYFTAETEWSDWKESAEDTSANYLNVLPQKI